MRDAVGMTDPTPPPPSSCPNCGSADVETGYLVDVTKSGRVDLQWSAGTVHEAFLVGSRRAQEAREVVALRCTRCGRLELFALGRMGPR